MRRESFDIGGLSKYLRRDARDLEKLAAQGRLPGRRVAGDWRFSRSEVNEWLEGEMADLSDNQLEGIEVAVQEGSAEEKLTHLVIELLSEATMAVPLTARTVPGVLKELVEVANQTWRIYDPEAVLDALKSREAHGSTALPGGVAIPHPRRPLPQALGDSVLAFGRTLAPIPFGGSHGGMTDLFFLVLCRDESMHLQVLARLARIIQRPGLLDGLRAAATPSEAYEVLTQVESEVLA